MKFGSMLYHVDDMLAIRKLHENGAGNERGLKMFVENLDAFPNRNRSQDNEGTQHGVTILGVYNYKAKANIHFHYCQMCEEAPSRGLIGAGMDNEHKGRGVYNVEISKSKVWFYKRYKVDINPYGKERTTLWGNDFSVPYKNN